MASRVLITGASGFIGGAAATRFFESGYRVRCVYRRAVPPPRLDELGAAGAELVRFDLESSADLDEVTSGCDGIVHVAAKVLDYGKKADFVRANVEATRRLVESGIRTGCRRFLFVSSISVHGFGSHIDSTESGPYYPLTSHYQRTKMQAENLVRGAGAPEFETVVVRPGLVYGPGDTTTLAPFFEMLKEHKLPNIAGFSSMNCPIFISDLVDGILKAYECKAATGRAFNLVSGEKATLIEGVSYAAELFGSPLSKITLPQWLVRGAAGVYEAISAGTGYRFRPPISRYLAKQLSDDFHFSPDLARSVLGFSPEVDWKSGLRIAAQEFMER